MKRVLTYGRRGHRIVNTSNEHRTSTENLPLDPSSSSRPENDTTNDLPTKIKQRLVKASSPSSKKVLRHKGATPTKKSKKSMSRRYPLALFESNTPGSPAQLPIVNRRAKAQGKKISVSPHHASSTVDIDIIVIDGAGRRVSQERRTSRSHVQANPPVDSPAPKPRNTTRMRKSAFAKQVVAHTPIVISSDTEEESPIFPKRTASLAQKRTIVVSSDESEGDDQTNPFLVKSKPLLPQPNRIPLPPPLPAYHERLVRSKLRQVTPIRKGQKVFPRPPSPSVDSDLDATFDFADTSLTASIEDNEAASSPQHLLPLLAECHQAIPHEFSAFIETFPFDPIVHPLHQASSSKPSFRKIGEASYSEVFGIGNVVLKIIPLRDEEQLGFDVDVDSPSPSDAKDVLKEINVTRSMGEICDGFIKLLRAYVVRGRYPSLLLSAWDNFNDTKGSESIKPDTFPVSQTYAIIVLPNGGPDLEAYVFSPSSKKRWTQASSIFWQVVRTLGAAESLVSFEHRDLHWGQILVQNFAITKPQRKINKASMDDASHAVTVTIIDLGLSRMNASLESIHWSPFEPEVFEGEGDYQFDIYRMMKEHNRNSWADYRPLSNVMWLHYLLRKLLTAKNLKAPAAPRKTTTATTRKVLTFTERECYLCLVEMESLLRAYLESQKQKPKPVLKGRRKTVAVVPTASVDITASVQTFACADDVLKYGVSMGWLSEL